METRDVLENSAEKLKKKNADMIAANCLKENGAGFGTDTNHLILKSRNGIEDLPMMSKEAAADSMPTQPSDSPGLDQTQTAHSQTSADTPAPAYRSARTERR